MTIYKILRTGNKKTIWKSKRRLWILSLGPKGWIDTCMMITPYLSFPKWKISPLRHGSVCSLFPLQKISKTRSVSHLEFSISYLASFISHLAFFILHLAFLSRWYRISYLTYRIFCLASRIFYLASRIFYLESRINLHCFFFHLGKSRNSNVP